MSVPAVVMSVASAGLIRRHPLKRSLLECRHRFFDCPVLSHIHGQSRIQQFPERSHPDSTHDDPIQPFAVQSLKRLATAVLVMPVAVLNCPRGSFVGVHNHEKRCGSEVQAYGALASAIFNNRYANIHFFSPVFPVETGCKFDGSMVSVPCGIPICIPS
jgi:hypothetical protein